MLISKSQTEGLRWQALPRDHLLPPTSFRGSESRRPSADTMLVTDGPEMAPAGMNAFAETTQCQHQCQLWSSTGTSLKRMEKTPESAAALVFMSDVYSFVSLVVSQFSELQRL